MLIDLIRLPFQKPPLSRYRLDKGKVCIELNLDHIRQLFDDRDPSPFRDRDLTNHSLEYIVGSTRELPQHTEVKLVLRMPTPFEGDANQDIVTKAIHSFFSYEKSLAQQKFMHNLRRARSAFAMGIIFLLICLFSDQMITQYLQKSIFTTMLSEGFAISGWVAMWKPVDILLYGWWPASDDIKTYDKLSKIEVECNSIAMAKPS